MAVIIVLSSEQQDNKEEQCTCLGRIMRSAVIAVFAVIGGVAITLLTGLVSNTPPGLVGAVWYGYPLVWLIRMIVAPQYNPWNLSFLNLMVDIAIWAIILGAALFVIRKIR